MAVGKKLKKYEWWFLVGLVIILLATFSVAGMCTGPAPGGPGRNGGTFQIAPNRREKLSDADVTSALRQYAAPQGLYQRALGPSVRWSSEWSGVAPEDRLTPSQAAWAHLVEVRSAVESGVRVGDEELRQALKRLIGTPSPEDYSQMVGRLGFASRAEFERVFREILVRDKFLTPLVEGMRWSMGRAEEFEKWKASRERVDLAYAAVRADQFKEAVEQEEGVRSALAEEGARLDGVVKATQAIRSLTTLALAEKTLPPDAAAFKKIEAIKSETLPLDPWKKELAYRVEGGKPVLSSAGPDGSHGTADDVTPSTLETLQSLSAVRQVGEALLVWRGSVQAWPDSLAKLAAPPPTGDGGRPLPAPLSIVPKDAWGRDLVYEAATPTLLSTGADGVRGTADDLVAEVTEKGVRVPVPASFDAWRTAGAKDAGGKPLRVQLGSANPPRFDVSSDGADGVAGTDDDVKDGNASDLSSFYAGARLEFREPDRRAFEALHVILPLVRDDAMKKAWADFPDYRPSEDECYDRFRVNLADASELGYYHVTEKTTVDGKEVVRDLDPADPEKGHGAALLRDLKTAKVIPDGAKAWLVPAPDVFGDQKDPPAPKPGEPPPADDARRKQWLEKGWRRVLLREMFFERLLADQLKKVQEAQKAHKKWEEAKKKDEKKEGDPKPGEEPKVPTFQELVARFRDYQPGEADRAEGARFVEYYTREPVSLQELTAIPEMADTGASQDLNRLKEGDVSAIPVVIKNSCARVAFHCTKFVAAHEPELATVRAKVWPKYLVFRAMERAARELQRIQDEVQKQPEGKLAPTLEEAAASVAAARGFKVTLGTSGLFVGSPTPTARPVPEDATAERKEEIARRNYVRTAGYRTVQPTSAGAGQPVPSTKVGTFGRRILRDDTSGDQGTGSAYLVRVREQRDPNPREFHARAYADWLARKAYDARRSSGRQSRELPLRSRSGYVEKELARYLDDWESIRRLWDIKADEPDSLKGRDAKR
jgi:hypothetical protein